MKKIICKASLGIFFLSCLFFFSSQVLGEKISINIEQFDHYPKDNYLMGYYRGVYFYESGTTADHAYYWYAHVNIPSNRIIRKLRINFFDYDLDAGDNVFCELRRVNKYTGENVTVYKVNSSGNEDEYDIGTAVQLVPEDSRYAYSNNDACSFYLWVYFGDYGSQLRFYGATIYFDDF